MYDTWRYAIAAIYVVAIGSLLGLLYLLRRPRPAATVTTAAITEQPTLPPVIAAHLLDASIPQPHDAVLEFYCPGCWLEDIAAPHMEFKPPMPHGAEPWFCVDHAVTALARAFAARGLTYSAEHQQQRQQREKYR